MVLRARANMGLRRDLDAQSDLRDIIRLDARCAIAYRLLGELAARRDENPSAAIFFREALRLDPNDLSARDWLAIVEGAPRVPAFPPTRMPESAVPRFARGTNPGEDTQRHTITPPRPLPTVERFARGSQSNPTWQTPAPQRQQLTPSPEPLPPAPEAPRTTLKPPPVPPQRLSAPSMRGPTPELPGFGEYLVASGILTRERLRAAQAYQRSMRVQLSTAIVTLGLATPQRIEWAAVAHQAQLAAQR